MGFEPTRAVHSGPRDNPLLRTKDGQEVAEELIRPLRPLGQVRVLAGYTQRRDLRTRGVVPPGGHGTTIMFSPFFRRWALTMLYIRPPLGGLLQQEPTGTRGELLCEDSFFKPFFVTQRGHLFFHFQRVVLLQVFRHAGGARFSFRFES